MAVVRLTPPGIPALRASGWLAAVTLGLGHLYHA